MGPLALADLIGLDTCVAIMEVLRRGLGDEKYAPCPLLVEHVAAGRLGRKSGRGLLRATSNASSPGCVARLASSAARSRQRAPHGREDLLAERVGGVEVGRAVHLEHDPAALAASGAGRRRRGRRRSPPRRRARAASASGGGTTGTRRGAERDVRSPFARLRVPRDRADDASRRDDQPQVVAARRDELLQHAAGRVEPDAAARLVDVPASSSAAVSQRTTSRPQLPKRGFSTSGGSS